MKLLPLVFANLLRKKIRTTLALGSFATALFLFALLCVVRDAFNQNVSAAGAQRLIVINKISVIEPLPLSYKDRLSKIAGVDLVNFADYFGGIYQNERNFFPQFAVDTETQRAMFPEYLTSDGQWSDFINDREGAIVGEGIAKRFGWKIGDRMPIRGTIFPGDWEFNIRGIYRGRDPADDSNQFWFHWDYFDERRSFQKGLVGFFNVRIHDPTQADNIVKAIDKEFANSSSETVTSTEKSFALFWVKQFGNIRVLLLTIGSVVFFTLLLVTGNTMALSVRERLREIAVLRALGFSSWMVFSSVLAESLFIALVGGILGTLVAKLFTLSGDPTHGLLTYFYLTVREMAIGVVVALITGAIAGLLPAVQAVRLRVAEALRRL